MSAHQLQRDLGRIEGKLDAVLQRLDEGSTKMGDHDTRLRRVEGKLNWYAGAAAVLGGFMGWLTAYLKAHT